jgi:hypothetical protein
MEEEEEEEDLQNIKNKSNFMPILKPTFQKQIIM